MFIATGRGAVYFLAIYAAIVLPSMFAAVWKWRKHTMQTRAWLSGSIDPPKERRLSPTAEAIALCAGVVVVAGFVAFAIVLAWGPTASS